MPALLTDVECRSVANALSAAAARWTEWSESIAHPGVAAQAKQAETFASLFLNASGADVHAKD